ncbi:hypothetical protein TRIUR3_08522 [Triticum urartu]|uniref:DUF295 domain-containing protein n=1 Tax=Triticum urartu TaxID=4572 RepID=M7YI23_TRIUA|nr:hypothetical protein TRIUR3_08522 [Triticum urartu]
MSSTTALPNKAVETCCRQEKRARIAGTATDPNWRDWADLIAGPVGLIAERVLADDVADYLRFRAVCRTWRRCTASPHAHDSLDRRFHPRRWIMLAQTLGAIRKRRDFLNISTGERIRVNLPELRYQYVFGATSDGGLIVLCDKRTYVVRLLNPLTRQLTTLPAAIRQQYTGSTQRRNGNDKQWTRLHTGHIITTLPFAGCFYCLTETALMGADTTASTNPQLAVAAELGDMGSARYDQTVKLVDNDGELVLVCRIMRDNNNTFRKGYEVYRVDLEAGITLPMQQGIGGGALFVCYPIMFMLTPSTRATAMSMAHRGSRPTFSFMAMRGYAVPLRLATVAVKSSPTQQICLCGNELMRRESKAYHPPSGHPIRGGNGDGSAIEPCHLIYGRIRVDVRDAQSCNVIEFVSHYVCGIKIIAHERRRSERLKLRRQL